MPIIVIAAVMGLVAAFGLGSAVQKKTDFKEGQCTEHVSVIDNGQQEYLTVTLPEGGTLTEQEDRQPQ